MKRLCENATRRGTLRVFPARGTMRLSLVFSGLLVGCGAGGGGSGIPDEGGTGGFPEGLVVSTRSLPAAVLDVPYEVSLAATGGTGPYDWALAPGATTPPGLALSPTGLLAGVPTETGSFSLDLRVADAVHAFASAVLGLAVALDVVDLRASPGPSAGTVVLSFTAPSPGGGLPVTGYVVRSSVRHIASGADLAAATVVPQTKTPSAPGTAESILLSGLEPGQTLQFHLQTVQGGVESGFSYAVGGRVADAAPSGAPAGAIALSAPATLSVAGATYHLTQDVSAAGTAFTITAKDVTLDLGGREVVYGTGAGTAYGVRARNLSGSVTVRNGRIRQGGGGGTASHAVDIENLVGARVSHVQATVSGTDADGVSISGVSGPVRVDHVTVACDTTTVTNRHWPGVAAIRVDEASGGAEIDHCLVTSSPQWGIRLQGPASSGPVLVHHNRVIGTKARVANGYMIGVYKRGADVFENECSGESRGVHVASDGSDGIDCRIHDNALDVRDQPNAEYPDFHWVHGIKVEGATGAKVHDNAIVGTADAAHAEVRAIDVALRNGAGDVHGVEVRRNRVTARATDAVRKAFAFHWTEGTSGACDLVVAENVFAATDRCVQHSWDGGRGAPFVGNALVRDLSLGAAHPFVLEDFGNGGTSAGGHGLEDSVTTEDLLAVGQYASAGAFDTVRRATLVVRAVDAAGAPIAGATVTVLDATGLSVLSGTTAANGAFAGVVTHARITNGPFVAAKGPFAVTVAKAGVGTWAGTQAVAGRTALHVNLAGGTASADATPPPAPTNVVAFPLSASRLRVRWSAADDPSGVATYLVRIDGRLAAVASGTSAVVTGLAPSSTQVVTVAAVDRGGNVSPAASAGPATLRPEDRGP
jgi:hypothetical protein